MKKITILGSAEQVQHLKKTSGTIISTDYLVDLILDNRGIKHKGINDYDIDLSKVPQKAWNLIKEFASKKIDDRTLEEHLRVNGVSMWQVEKIPFYFVMLKIVKLTDILERIISEEKPDQIHVLDHYSNYLVEKDRDFLFPLVCALSEKHGIRLVVHKSGGNIIRENKQRLFESSLRLINKYRNIKRGKLNNLSGSPDVLFYQFGTSNMRVTEKLYDEHKNAAYVLGDGPRSNSAGDYADDNKLQYTYIDGFRPKKLPNYRKLGHHNEMFWNKIKDTLLREILVYNDVRLLETLWPVFENLFVKRFRENILLSVAHDNLVKTLKPKIGFLTNDTIPWGYLAAMALKRNSVPSVLLAHGPLANPYTTSEPNTDKMFIWSELEKQNMISYGISEDKMQIMGTDSYNHLLERFAKTDVKAVRSELGIKNRKIVLFATRLPIEKDFRKIRRLIGLFDSYAQVQLVIKFHPSDLSVSPERLKSLFRARNTLFVRDFVFYKMLVASDLLITSSVCRTSIDAIIFGIPLVLWDTSEKEEDMALRINFDESLKPFVRINTLEGLDQDVLDIKVKKSVSQDYHKKYYSGMDLDSVKKYIQEF